MADSTVRWRQSVLSDLKKQPISVAVASVTVMSAMLTLTGHPVLFLIATIILVTAVLCISDRYRF